MPNLDPLPYRYLNNSNIRYDKVLNAALPSKAVFDPRPEYSQNREDYQ